MTRSFIESEKSPFLCNKIPFIELYNKVHYCWTERKCIFNGVVRNVKGKFYINFINWKKLIQEMKFRVDSLSRFSWKKMFHCNECSIFDIKIDFQAKIEERYLIIIPPKSSRIWQKLNWFSGAEMIPLLSSIVIDI